MASTLDGMTPRRIALTALLCLCSAVGCQSSRHPVQAATLGASAPLQSLESVVDKPGPLEVETIVAADWHVPLSGLVNLDHPKAQAAGLEDREEPIAVYFHAVRHPTHGLFIVDTGIEQALKEAPEEAAIRGIAASVLHVEDMVVRQDTASWIAAQPEPLAGVFLTHLHLDHVSGLPDVPCGTPIYSGPGESSLRSFENVAVRPILERTLEGHAPLQELQFSRDADGQFDGVLDVFGDGSLWAIAVPGHTPGSTAFVARTPKGPVLLTGDASHTRWGWDHGVEPGSFSHDQEQSAQSLAKLRAFAASHPSLDVRVGHQAAPAMKG